jgi:hypothetical protein
MTNDYEQLADAEQASRSVFMAEIAALKADLRRLEEELGRVTRVIQHEWSDADCIKEGICLMCGTDTGAPAELETLRTRLSSLEGALRGAQKEGVFEQVPLPEPSHEGSCSPMTSCDVLCMERAYVSNSNAARRRLLAALSTEPQGHEDWLEASNRHAEAAGKILAEAHEQCTVPDCPVCTARPTGDARAEEKR